MNYALCGCVDPECRLRGCRQFWPKQPPSYPTFTTVAGHCGKCGAPYTMDMLAGMAPAKFIPGCKCWNV